MSAWSPERERDVAKVLLGSWPNHVAAWGREAIAAYVEELASRGLTPEAAIMAVRSSESIFPPSAGELAQAARVDPGRPTFDEAWILIERELNKVRGGTETFKEPAEKDRAANQAALTALDEAHPLVRAFVERQGVSRLRTLGLHDEDYGAVRRKELRESWEAHVDAFDGREIHAIAAGAAAGRDGFRQLDPLGAIPRPELQTAAATTEAS